MKNIKNSFAQTSVFIIIGIVIISMVVLILFQMNIIKMRNSSVSEIKELNSFIEGCIKKSASDAVYYISDSGGYYNLPELATDNKVAYYYYNKRNYMPSKEKIKTELEEFMNNALFLCTKNFVDFPDYKIKGYEINTSVEILDDRVVFKIKYPLSISKGDKTYSLKNFETSVKIRLGIIYNSIKQIIDEQMKSDEICINCIGDLAVEKNLYITMMDYQDSVIFGVYDIENDLNGGEYVFFYANKYK